MMVGLCFNVKDIVKDWLRQKGYGGLYNEDIECGCELADLMPCGGDGVDGCEAGCIAGPDEDEPNDGSVRWVTGECERKAPRIVCLCGSGRFREAFERAECEETLAGKIVLTIGCNAHDVARSADLAHHKPMLDELHLRKIDLADEVLVLNVGGYIGESTARELAYAREHGKAVRFLEPEAVKA